MEQPDIDLKQYEEPVNLGTVKFAPDTVLGDEENLKISHFNVPFVVEHVLSQWTIIQWMPGEQPRDRIFRNESIKNRHFYRQKEAVDSLQSIREYFYIDPEHVVIVQIDKDYPNNPEVAAKTKLLLKEKGFDADQLEMIDKGIQYTIEQNKQECDYDIEDAVNENEKEYGHAVSELAEEERSFSTEYKKKVADLESQIEYSSTQLSAPSLHNGGCGFGSFKVVAERDLADLKEESLKKKKELIARMNTLKEEKQRKDKEAEETLRKKHEISCFPMCRMGMNEKNAPKICMVQCDKVKDSVYYASCTSVPQGMNELVLGTYIDAVVNYTKQQIERQGNIKEIPPAYCIYYDYLVIEHPADVRLYLFINLRKRVVPKKKQQQKK